ncbi:hypothetical protein OROGR_022835 [Orobanche gracilis]
MQPHFCCCVCPLSVVGIYIHYLLSYQTPNTNFKNTLKISRIHTPPPLDPMAETCIIIRKSIFTFLQKYQYFTSIPTLLAFPYAVSYLLTQALVSSSDSFPLIDARLRALFLAAMFPLSSSQPLTVLNRKLSQTSLSFLFVSPFTFSFLLLARASVIIKSIDGHRKVTFSSLTTLFIPLVITQFCNTLLILAANATCFFLFAIFFNFFNILGLPSSHGPLPFLTAIGAVIYSIILANSYVICNLASISSGMENRGGFVSILKACVMIRGRMATALSLAVTMNMALAAIEALFHCRVVRRFHRDLAPDSVEFMEGIFIACLYAVFLVIDTIVGCTFWKSCKKVNQMDQYFHQIEIQVRSDG